MIKTASERLLERVNQLKPDSFDVSADDIARIPLDDQMVSEIMECLSNRDIHELKWGLWFALGTLGANPPQDFLRWLMPKIPVWLKHRDGVVRERALDIFMRLRDNYKIYKEVMVGMLRDVNPVVRWRALREYKTFLTREDIPVLLDFQSDRYMTESSMGSPMIYAIRNDALEAIEDLCGKRFSKSEKVEPSEAEQLVYWWDWQPFLDWWNGQQRGWHFSRKL